MKILTVSYRALRTGRGYNNQAVEATAEVQDIETPDEALRKLRSWVDSQVDERLKAEEYYEDLSNIRDRAAFAQRELERVEKRAHAYRELLKEKPKLSALAQQHGLGGDALLLDNI